MKMDEIEQNIKSLDGMSMVVYLAMLESLNEKNFDEEYAERLKRYIFKKIVNGENIELTVETDMEI